MFHRTKKQKNAAAPPASPPAGGGAPQNALSASLEANIKLFQTLFADVDMMRSRRFENAKTPKAKFFILYSDGVVDSELIGTQLILPLVLWEDVRLGPELALQVKQQIAMVNDVKESRDFSEIITAVTYGDTMLLMEGCATALLFNSKKFTLRSSTEPEGEKVLTGPREGFTEGIMANLSMLRRKLRTNELKLKFSSLGRHSRTAICVAYMDNIVNKKILDELWRRLGQIDIDGILDSNYITEFISERSFLGFNLLGTTERPDVAAARLLEGRIAIFVDGTPVVLTAPYLFIENFQSNEDYYMSPLYDSYGRFMRITCFLLSVLIPAAYIAIVSFHHEILPTSLMLSFGMAHSDTPLPTALECLVMLLVFDILRETGVRLPGHVGQALSIVGALVIGQTAVDAKLVTAPTTIVVALTGITVMVIPRLTTAGIAARYLCLALASILGLVGCMIGGAITMIHLLNLKTMGIPYLISSAEKLNSQTMKDTLIRTRWPRMVTRTGRITANVTRMKPPTAMPGEKRE